MTELGWKVSTVWACELKQEKRILAHFGKCCVSTRSAKEFEGSKLDERQTAQVMNVLAAHNVIAEYYAIDMALHPGHIIDEFKKRRQRR